MPIVSGFVLAAALALADGAGAAPAAALDVTIRGVHGATGTVRAAVCDKDTFLGQCAWRAAAPAANGSVVLHFDGVPPGTWAVMAYHDENDSGKLDKAANGIPLEGYGFSRNAVGNWGPPDFAQAAIELKPGPNATALDLSY